MKAILYASFLVISAALTIIISGNNFPSENNVSENPDLIGSWTTGANMPVFAYNGAAFSYTRNDTGWVYCVSGELSGGTLTTQNYRYNVLTNVWDLKAFYPTAPGVWYTSGASIGTNGYVCGGLTGGTLANVTAQCTKYDINANTWTVMAPMPAPRGQNKIAGYQDSLLYSAGGFDVTGTYQVNVYLYNQNSNSWRTATPLPAGRGSGGFALSGDTLVYVNGYTGSFGSTTVLSTYVGVISQADRAVITWTLKANYPGTARTGQGAQNWGCKGIILSGGSTPLNATNECYTYSPGANIWSLQAPLITSRSGHMSGLVKSVFFNVLKFVNVCGYNGSNVLTTDIFTDNICSPFFPYPQTTVCRNGINVAVPDNSPAGDRDTIRVILPTDCMVVDVNAGIQTFSHTFDADMQFSLSHNNTSVNLISNRGGSGDNFLYTLLDDSAAIPISAGTAPFAGSFRPEQSLSPFNSQPAYGNWVLFMVDNAAADLGFLHDWCVLITYTFGEGGIHTIEIPNHFRLYQNYPNPFNPTTTIKYGLPKPGVVKIVIYDILGKEITTLVNERKDAGTYEVRWDASKYSSGIYFYTLESGDFKETKKMLMLK